MRAAQPGVPQQPQSGMTPPPYKSQQPVVSPKGKTSASLQFWLLGCLVILILAAVGGYYYYHQSEPNNKEQVTQAMDSTAVAVDSAMVEDSLCADTCVAEPEETLEIPTQSSRGARHLLATYRYGDLKRDYYYNQNNAQLSIYDENGKCLKKHNLTDNYGILMMADDWRNGKRTAVAKLYNHHVYFVGEGGGSSGDVYTIFYLTPQEGNGIHVIGYGSGENGYKLQKNSVRVQHMRCINENTAKCCADYEYEKYWETIPLQ